MSDKPVRLRVVVKRKEWLRGEGAEASSLLRREDLKMCCMGFASLQSGCTPSSIIGQNEVSYEWMREALDLENDRVIRDLYVANDTEGVDEDGADDATYREEKIIQLGAQIGIAFTFVD